MEPIASHFGHSGATQCLENGLFWDKKWVKNGSKMSFSNDTFGLFGVHKQVEWAHFEPMLSNFGPSQGRKGPENGLFWSHKWLKKTGQNHGFPKMILVRLWCPNG